MNLNNNIGWCSATWNPVVGCTNNCPYCYAVKMAKRLASMGCYKYHVVLKQGEIHKEYFDWNGKTYFEPRDLKQPLHVKKPQRIFVCSMGDLLCKAVPSAWIEQILDIVKKCPQHTFQFLTQNPERYSEFNWPDNCWLGITVRNNNEKERTSPLLEAGAKVRYLSIEPCLENINFNATSRNDALWLWHISWVIVGCATDSRAKDCKIEWIESIVEQCDSAGVPVWVKQIPINGKVCKDITRFPKHLQRRELPK